MTSPETNELPDATTAPFEFALLALNLVDEEAFAADDGSDIDGAVLDGGFSLQYSLGQSLEFSLSYDEEAGRYTAAVRSTQPLFARQPALLALQLNHLMPQERRFSVDALTQCLVLHETWSGENLDMVELAEGVRGLIDAMVLFLSPPLPVTAQPSTVAAETMLRV